MRLTFVIVCSVLLTLLSTVDALAQRVSPVQRVSPAPQRVSPEPPTKLQLQPAPPKHRRRVGFLVAGGIAAGVGATGLIGSVIVGLGRGFCHASDGHREPDDEYYPDDENGCTDIDQTYTTLVVASVALIAVSIPLFIIGSVKVPVSPAGSNPPHKTPPLSPHGRFVLSATMLGARGAGLQFTGTL